MHQLTFSKNIRRIRKALGMTQEALAEKTQISATHISRIECGVENNVRQKNLDKIANALGVTFVELFSETTFSQSEACNDA